MLRRKWFTFLLIYAIIMLPFNNVRASMRDKDGLWIETIDLDTAVSIGVIFVSNMTKNSDWNTSTQIDFVCPLYNYDGIVSNYYIELKTGDRDYSYVIVSADPRTPLITEYSDQTILSVKCNGSGGQIVPVKNYPKDKKIYYSTFICSDIPLAYCVSKEEVSNTAEEYFSFSEKIIRFIRTYNLYFSQSSCCYGFSHDPVTYIQTNYPSVQYWIYSNGHTVIGTVENYHINEWNACVVYSTAAIIKYYKSYLLYSAIVSTCEAVARNNGYASNATGTWNYRIQVGSTENYVNDCLSYYGITDKNALSFLLLSGAKNEINNNRPCILNIGFYNSINIDHAVTAIGWNSYLINSENHPIITFYKVKDGDCNSDRYVCDDAITGVFVTKIYPVSSANNDD